MQSRAHALPVAAATSFAPRRALICRCRDVPPTVVQNAHDRKQRTLEPPVLRCRAVASYAPLRAEGSASVPAVVCAFCATSLAPRPIRALICRCRDASLPNSSARAIRKAALTRFPSLPRLALLIDGRSSHEHVDSQNHASMILRTRMFMAELLQVTL